MNWNKYFKAIFVVCMLTMFIGCGPSQTASDEDGKSRNNYLNTVEVKSVVLENAGFSEENVRFVRFKLNSENGSAKYDVEFVSDTMEYDYTVDAITGEILSMNCEIGHYDIDKIPTDIASVDHSQDRVSQDANQQEGNAQTGNQQEDKQTENRQNHNIQNGDSQNGADGQYIGREAAQQAALAHAGLNADAVRFAHTHLEFDDGRWKYDVEFHKGNEEYDYDIDALTGEILSHDCYAKYINPEAAAAQSGEYITQEKAKQLALAHAGISENDAQSLKVEFDYDDGRAEYEVEWDVGQMEYSCDVDAYTGEILSFKKEMD